MTRNEQTNEQLATSRVRNDDDLHPHRDILIDYEWDNQAEHLAWIATADKKEIMSWIQSVRNGESN